MTHRHVAAPQWGNTMPAGTSAQAARAGKVTWTTVCRGGAEQHLALCGGCAVAGPLREGEGLGLLGSRAWVLLVKHGERVLCSAPCPSRLPPACLTQETCHLQRSGLGRGLAAQGQWQALTSKPRCSSNIPALRSSKAWLEGGPFKSPPVRGAFSLLLGSQSCREEEMGGALDVPQGLSGSALLGSPPLGGSPPWAGREAAPRVPPGPWLTRQRCPGPAAKSGGTPCPWRNG